MNDTLAQMLQTWQRGGGGEGGWVNSSTFFVLKIAKADGKSAAMIAFLAPGTVSCKSVNWRRMSVNLIRNGPTPPGLRWGEREKRNKDEEGEFA